MSARVFVLDARALSSVRTGIRDTVSRPCGAFGDSKIKNDTPTLVRISPRASCEVPTTDAFFKIAKGVIREREEREKIGDSWRLPSYVFLCGL